MLFIMTIIHNSCKKIKKSSKIGVKSLSLNDANLSDIIHNQSHQSIDCLTQIPLYQRRLESFDNIICHIGVGGFFRSHQAIYAHKLLIKSNKTHNGSNEKRWGFVGIGLMPSDNLMKHVTIQQDCMFTVTALNSEHTETTIVGSMIDFIYTPQDESGQAVIERLANPSTKIVSLTITEKGYCLSVDRKLDLDNNLVKHDLENPNTRMHSAVGLIVKALMLRRLRGIDAFTVLSCDNLPGNGILTKTMVIGFLDAMCYKYGSGYCGENDTLRKWVTDHVKFPNTMVDRITPVTKPEQVKDDFSDDIRKFVKERYGIEDQWPVVAELYSQWIIEDNFVNNERPYWELLSGDNVLIVDHVHCYEMMKIRLLNAGHSALSYVSLLMGYIFVDEAMKDVQIQSFLKAFLKEQQQSLLPVPGVNITLYKESLIKRFSNPFIKDKLSRLAEDGSNKILITMRDAALSNIHSGKSVKHFCFVLATWIRYLCAFDESGNTILIKDTSSTKVEMMIKKSREILMVNDAVIPEISIKHSSCRSKIIDFIGTIFGNNLSTCEPIIAGIIHFLTSICSNNIKYTLSNIDLYF